MHGLAALLFPTVLMLFAMGMDKLQARIDRSAVSRDDVEDFLESADSRNVDTLARDGMPAALDELRSRRVTRHEAVTDRSQSSDDDLFGTASRPVQSSMPDRAASPQRAS